MAWPFKRNSKADVAIAVMDDAIEFASDKWLYFSRTLVFKDEVTLKDRIAAFLPLATEGLRGRFSALKDAPGAVVLLVVVKGVELSGTHSRAELEKSLGIEIPD